MSLEFARGSSEYLNDSTWTEATGPTFTMGAWARVTSDNICTIISIGDVSVDDSYFSLTRHSSGDVIQGLISDPSFGAASFNGGAMAVNEWHHVVYLQVGTSSRFTYLDGVASSENTSSRTPTGIDNIAIGARATVTAATFWDGQLFWPFVYDIALTAGEIKSLSDGVDPRAVQGANLVSFPDFTIAPAVVRDRRRGTTFTVNGTPTLSYIHPQVARLGPRGRGRLARVG